MKYLLSLLIAATVTVCASAQDIQNFSNTKYRITNAGQYSESSTGMPSQLTVNGVDQTISITTESGDIQGFLDYNTRFTIRYTEGQGRNKSFLTTEGFIFQVRPMERRILIYKEHSNIRMDALWLDEIEFK